MPKPINLAAFLAELDAYMVKRPKAPLEEVCAALSIKPATLRYRLTKARGKTFRDLYPAPGRSVCPEYLRTELEKIRDSNPLTTQGEACQMLDITPDKVSKVLGQSWEQFTGITMSQRKVMRKKHGIDSVKTPIVVPRELTMPIRSYRYSREVYCYA